MNRELELRLKQIEQEILDLKTASEYSSVRSSSIVDSELLSTGNYRVTFDNHGNEVFAAYFTRGAQGVRHGGADAYPPQGSTQIVQVDASYASSDSPPVRVDYNVILTIVSNYPVVSIERIN